VIFYKGATNMNLLLLLLIVMTSPSSSGRESQECPGFPWPEFVLECYPETVMPGDTFYATLVAKNPFDETIFVSEIFNPGDMQICLKDSENNTCPLFSVGKLFPPPRYPTARVSVHAPITFAEIQPMNSHIIYTWAVSVPPLEDMKEPFWEKLFNHPEDGDGKVAFCMNFTAYSDRSHYGDDDRKMIQLTLETPIVVKQRHEKETALIQKWNETLADFLESEEFRETGIIGAKSDMPKNTVVKNEKFSHWHFFRTCNFCPNTSDIPETWQGWKELEDSLTPSTMRDEIRLARILIQYCDTENEAVLKELKEWFDDMNEIQRAVVIASFLRHLPGGCFNESPDLLFPPLSKIYKTIREYDVVPIPKGNERQLRNLGLLE